jgi:3-methyladenine DNA glycosylase AlkD
MHSYILPLQQQFIQHQDPERAIGAKAYMRNQFEFYGMEAKQWRLLVKTHIKALPLLTLTELPKVIKQLWQLPQREYQYAAVEIMASCQKQWTPAIIALIEYCLVHKSWWDSVDQIASLITGRYFQLFPQQIAKVTGRWNKHPNIWLQRSSIMFQKFYKKDTDTNLLASYIVHLSKSNEFFVQKAIGWALREYAKTNPNWVTQFVAHNALPPLSQREALKRLN